MLSRLESRLRRLRRWFSRSEWAAHLLQLSRSAGLGAPPGLILIQIDGLSFTQLQKALEQDRLPFLRSLLERERYKASPFYSGLPSATPGIQGELFYGVKGCVPAFSFLDRASGRIHKMYDPAAVQQVERRLIGQGEALLEGGSAYADIFGGGAKEKHFCGGDRGWKGIFWAAHPFRLPFLALLYADVVLRAAALVAWEALLALFEALRGARRGQDLIEELKFIGVRLSVCVILRELIVTGAQIDIARGLPVIHLNFFGYDEQSHRRGPTSRFAHWALQGIDHSAAKVWRAAHQSARRSYDVWIYSDHGQEETLPYPVEHGRPLQEAVDDLFRREMPPDPKASAVVTGMGPIQHLYPPQPLSEEGRERLAHALIETLGIPTVLAAAEEGKAKAWTDHGTFRLPEEASEVLGARHPFLEEAAQDLTALCHHPDAGSLLLSGWRQGRPAKTFPSENGSHAGPGFEETRAFVLLPTDAPVDENARILRPLDLRAAALKFLGRKERSPAAPRGPSPGPTPTLRIMTYNVHSCVGMDGRLSPERIARVIARHRPDAVALQELDVHRPRTGGMDQAEEIARKLSMAFHFHASYRVADGQYGNAIFSRFPMRLMRAASLPRLQRRGMPGEPRGALWVEMDVEGAVLHLINAHLSLWPAERALQAETLLGPEWVGSPEALGPMVVCGDFNAAPDSPVYRRFTETFRDAQLSLPGRFPQGTWFSRHPFTRIDHLFTGPGTEVRDIAVPRTELDRVSSDHLPLLVELRLVVVRRPRPQP